MTVRTTYFGGLGSTVDPDEQDHVFGVVRYPRGFVARVTDRNIPEVAPPKGLLNAYKEVEGAAQRNGDPNPAAIAWESVKYEPRYLAYLEKRGPQIVLEELRELVQEADVWLVCWEKDARWCHRRLLANAVAADLEGVEVVHHPDPSTIPVDDGDEADEPEATLADFAGGA